MNRPVVLVSHGFQPNYEKGYANGLARNGVQVEVVGADRTLYAELHPAIRAINLRGSQNPKRLRLVKALNLLAYVFKLYAHIYINRPRVLHLDGLLLGGVGLVAVIELCLYRLGSKQLWLTVHNLVPHDKQLETNHAIMRLMYKVPHRLITHTKKMRCDLIESFGVAADRIVVMEHGVDTVPESTAYPLHGPSLKVLLFGAVLPYKGIDIFLEALQFCGSVTIDATIAGEPRSATYAARVEKMISEVAQSHRVRWIRGFIPESEVQSYFEQADLVVMPYRHIDQSGVLFTAYRFGAPVVCFDVGAFREYVPEYAGMVVPDQTPQALAEGLRTFSANKTRFDRKAIQAYARSFAWENTVRILLPYLNNAGHT